MAAARTQIRMRLSAPPSWIRLVMLGTASSLFGLADGCLRKSSSYNSNDNNSDRDSSEDRPLSPTSTETVMSHHLPCHEYEVFQAACLNGGTCFVTLGHTGARHLACRCQPEFIGDRCQEFYIDPAILQLEEQNIRTAHVTAAVSVLVLVFFVVLLMVYVYIKYRRKASIPLESKPGPRLEIGEYTNYNKKVNRLSATTNNMAASSGRHGNGATDGAPLYRQLRDPEAVAAARFEHETATPTTNAKPPAVNGGEVLNSSTAPLLPEMTPNRNGDAVNPDTSFHSSINGDTSFNPSVSADDIPYIDETLPRRPKANHNKQNNTTSESQV